MVIEITERGYSVFLLSKLLDSNKKIVYPETIFNSPKVSEGSIDSLLDSVLGDKLTLSNKAQTDFSYKDIVFKDTIKKQPHMEFSFFGLEDGWYRVDDIIVALISDVVRDTHHVLVVSFKPISGDPENGFMIHDKCVISEIPSVMDLLPHEEFCVLSDTSTLLKKFKLITKKE